MPALTAKVSLETKSKKDQKLDDSGFTVQDLAEELENGEGYTLVCEADPDTEGEYPVEVVLSEEIREEAGEGLGRTGADPDEGRCISGEESCGRLGRNEI